MQCGPQGSQISSKLYKLLFCFITSLNGYYTYRSNLSCILYMYDILLVYVSAFDLNVNIQLCSLTASGSWVINLLLGKQWRKQVFQLYLEVKDYCRYHITHLQFAYIQFYRSHWHRNLKLWIYYFLFFLNDCLFSEHRRGYQARQWNWLSCDDQGTIFWNYFAAVNCI